MFKLEKQIIHMENFANHLEEVFITVEVRAGMVNPSHHTAAAGGRLSGCGWGGRLCPDFPPALPGDFGDIAHGARSLSAFPPAPKLSSVFLASALLQGGALSWPSLDQALHDTHPSLFVSPAVICVS